MTIDLKSAKILVTGASGFLGRHLVEKLRSRGYSHLLTPPSTECDLTREQDVTSLFAREKPEVVIHLAAVVGGIGANRAQPGRFFHDNAVMGIHLIEQARRTGVAKFVCVGTICAYPKHTPVPFREEALWDGYPEETNAPYGLAKKMQLVMLQAYRAQYGLNGIYLLPVNLYGPGDNFNPETSHVIPALMRKCREAIRNGSPEIEVWGSGAATREFLHVSDAAEAVCLATERYNDPDPVNIGYGGEIAIRDLVALIVRISGFKGSVRWDATKPDGQPRRMLDTTRARERFGFAATTPLEEGLRQVWDWYLRQE